MSGVPSPETKHLTVNARGRVEGSTQAQCQASTAAISALDSVFITITDGGGPVESYASKGKSSPTDAAINSLSSSRVAPNEKLSSPTAIVAV